jgi:hypothetical protein
VGHIGTVHGAIETGQHAASAILERLSWFGVRRLDAALVRGGLTLLSAESGAITESSA